VADLSPTVADSPWITPELLEFRSNVVAFARGELAQAPADRIARDREGTFWREGWDACGRFGIQGLPVPETLGGQGQDALTTAVALEALGYACEDGGLLFSINAHLWSAVTPVWKHGSPDQQRTWLPGLCDGTLIGIHAVTEPEAGSDAFGMTTRAEPEGDGWRITGRKTFISNAPVADLLIVFARTTPGTGPTGITAFLLEREAGGMDVPGHLDKMGLRTSPMGEIVLQDVRAGPDDVLGTEGRGARVFQTSMDWERGLIMSSQVGAMQRITERTIRYATQRQQFGQPIGRFESVSEKIADMSTRLQASRAMLYRAAHVMDAAAGPTASSAQAKVFISEASVATHLDAMQVHGGYGYMTELEVERALRDALGGTIYSGTSEIQRRLIAKRLGL
jgi:L-prolyl-PCP dehydrogenase